MTLLRMADSNHDPIEGLPAIPVMDSSVEDPTVEQIARALATNALVRLGFPDTSVHITPAEIGQCVKVTHGCGYLIDVRRAHTDKSSEDAAYVFEFGGKVQRRPLRIPERVLPVEGTSLLNVVARNTPRDSALLFRDGQPAPFPALRTMWTEVQGLRVDQASALVDERLAAARQQVTFIGLTLDEGFATVIGPALLLCILSYLWLYIAHAHRVLRPDDVLEPREFAWPVMFPGAVPPLAGLILIVSLPLAASISIAMRPFTSGMRATRFATGGLCVAVSLVALGTHLSIRRLQSRVGWHKPRRDSVRTRVDHQSRQAIS